MSNHYTFNFTLFDGLPAAAILLAIAGGGGTFAAIRRNWRRARQADPEAIEMEATAAAQGQATVEATGTVEGSGTVEAIEDVEGSATLEVEGRATLNVGDDADASN